MKVNKTELETALEKVKPGLANKEFIEQSTSFAFMKDRIVTYNDEISISHPVKGLNMEGAIKAEEFYKLLNKIKTDTINIEPLKNEVIVSSKKFKAGIPFHAEVKLPIAEIGKIKKWKKLPKNFLESIEFTLFSCSRDDQRPILKCIHFDKSGKVESSDSFRLTKYDLGEKLPVDNFLILATTAQQLINYDVKYVSKTSGWVHFKTIDNTVFSCRVFEDEYPDTDALYEIEGHQIKFPKGISEILDRAEVFSKRENVLNEFVNVDIQKNRILIESQGDYGWFKEKAKIKYNDKKINFAIHPKFLQDICERIEKAVVADRKLKFNGDNWQHIVALTEDTE